jgi:hypothetical protein
MNKYILGREEGAKKGRRKEKNEHIVKLSPQIILYTSCGRFLILRSFNSARTKLFLLQT